ncbi:hypothetical protein [Flavobacterium sp. 5]|uniref:hypothetical protein n=1 Tax=Flavobacterium sp. 5 TaxID=2035199 RepID=UPI000C2C11C8|nr:hypothetical protein [Flavobacterium sp. 5]PKB18042.1 hypothetical protein CLU82_3297 [Flavobacterium sp. 5]
MENLFTKEELTIIENEAESNWEYYYDATVINGNATQISIKTISKNNKLIFVEGNLDTGFKHLNERHSFLSFKNYWIPNEIENLKLDNPSKFNPRMMPIIDYVKIADTIFCEENKNITKNNKPDVFDKYTGYYNYNQSEKYHLITYKNTKIVHTLFPDKKLHNSKRKCKFGKGISKISTKLPEGYNDLFVPYENNKGKTAYSILFRKYYLEKVERIFIQKHDNNENPIEQYLLAYRNFENYKKFEREDMNFMQIGDLTDFEKIINEIDENSKK